MKKFGLLLLSFLITMQAANAASQEQPADSQQRAERLWQMAIAAKGGLERLHAVHNLVESYGKKHPSVFVYSFPNKLWRWMDDRPTPLGLTVDMVNVDARLAYVLYPEKSPIRMQSDSGLRDLWETQLHLLLDTNWVSPKPYLAEESEMEGKTVDIVYAMVGNEKVSFTLDRKTHLPLAITSYKWHESHTFPKGQVVPAREISVTDKFKDYREVNGVLLPHRICFACSRSGNPRPMRERYTQMSFLVNADLNEKIFTDPPNTEQGAGVWDARNPPR